MSALFNTLQDACVAMFVFAILVLAQWVMGAPQEH